MRKFLERLQRARFTPRFSTYALDNKDNVAEHSWLVTAITLLLVKLVTDRGQDVDQGKALAFAAMHDYEETILGDVIAGTKQHMEEQYQRIAEEKVYATMVSIPSRDKGSIYGSWRWAKHITVEGTIVSYADMLATKAAVRSGLDAKQLGEKIDEQIHLQLDMEKNAAIFEAVKEVFYSL